MKEKYTFKKNIFAGVVVGLGIAIYMILYVVSLSYEFQDVVWIRVMKTASLIGVSILATSMLSVYFIEVKNRNDSYHDFIYNELLSTPSFYEKLDNATQKKILKDLEKNLYFEGDEILSEIYAEMRGKMPKFKEHFFYYDDYNVTVNCKVKDNQIQKSITKTFNLKSYDDTVTISNYPLANHVCENENQNATIFDFSAKMMNKNGVYNEIDVKIDKSQIIDAMDKKCGYNSKTTVAMKDDLVLYKDKSVKITVNYKTIVDITDKMFILTTRAPCRKSNFTFGLSSENNSHNKFKLVPCAFGFVDDAKNSHNDPDNEHMVTLTFPNWIFPKDGVVIELQEKAQK